MSTNPPINSSKHAEMAELTSRIISVRELLMDQSLAIPHYQRPYKWTGRNINQLFSDVAIHKDKSSYLALINPKTTGSGSGGFTEKMSGKIVAAILENPEITIPELAGRLKRTERTIERLINRLKTDDVIKRIGPAKGRHWEVLK